MKQHRIITRVTILWWYYYFKKKRAFRRHAEACKVETINDRSLSDLLFFIKNSIIGLFDDFLWEKKGFKYNISTKITLKRRISDNETRYRIFFSNSETKIIINQRYHITESFEKNIKFFGYMD